MKVLIQFEKDEQDMHGLSEEPFEFLSVRLINWTLSFENGQWEFSLRGTATESQVRTAMPSEEEWQQELKRLPGIQKLLGHKP